MLGTRTVSERLRQLLLILAETYGRHENGQVIVDRTITYDQIASIVGATRQWVTQSLDRLQSEGVLTVTRKEITISDLEKLLD
jgi:CRP/FNR family cyclic AMP-dependent transcriptional regulator